MSCGDNISNLTGNKTAVYQRVLKPVALCRLRPSVRSGDLAFSKSGDSALTAAPKASPFTASQTLTCVFIRGRLGGVGADCRTGPLQRSCPMKSNSRTDHGETFCMAHVMTHDLIHQLHGN